MKVLFLGNEVREVVIMNISWSPSRSGEVALNCDGSVMNVGLNAACGDLLRDENGAFSFPYAVKLGSRSIFAAELWGIWHGLKVALCRGFHKIAVYSDSCNAIILLTKGCCSLHPCYSLVKSIHNIHQYMGQVAWIHVYQEANQVASSLAKYGINSLYHFKIFDVAPDFILKN